ncbi:hypothetical protein MAPG_08723 [Magnaporthiopsis poae ATCC 64411]|uniref:Uncharacterized protein n=1 Tax=Magnaporthiopsis poae (strain ATCC 64411 / 73-15) TaxID=644358 RepID=A0A0C4E835_MAGP6|nr:hypothetical protein MAPG_08723 [Magnaporthiopsis poae ATCC 64411]
MNSFYDQPYTSSNRSVWVELMNKSTADWGLSPFPANVVALNGSLADAPQGSVPTDAIVIENAGRTLLGDRPIEPIVFGITSSLAVICVVVFIVVGFMNKSFGLSDQVVLPGEDSTERRPLGPSALERGHGGIGSGPNSPSADGPHDFVTKDGFRRSLRDYYYPPTVTETELRDKDFVLETVDGDDVEAVTELLRKMYATDLEIWSRSGDHSFNPDAHKTKSDAILAEVRNRFEAWGASANHASSTVDWRGGDVTLLDLPEGWQAADPATLLQCLEHDGQAQEVMQGISRARAGWTQDEVPELLKAGLFLFSAKGIHETRYS